EVDLTENGLVSDDAVRRACDRARKEAPANHSGQREDEIADVLDGQVGEPAQEDREEQGSDQRLHDRPADPDGSLLVLDLEVARREREEDLAVAPELREAGQRRPPAPRVDDRYGRLLAQGRKAQHGAQKKRVPAEAARADRGVTSAEGRARAGPRTIGHPPSGEHLVAVTAPKSRPQGGRHTGSRDRPRRSRG